jgi:hypothetical protein
MLRNGPLTKHDTDSDVLAAVIGHDAKRKIKSTTTLRWYGVLTICSSQLASLLNKFYPIARNSKPSYSSSQGQSAHFRLNFLFVAAMFITKKKWKISIDVNFSPSPLAVLQLP